MKTAVKLFLDTEFNGTNGCLISAVLVSAQGHEWYEVLDTGDTPLMPWVVENVMPVLGKPGISMEAFEHSLSQFLSQFGYVEFVYNAHADKRYLDAMLDGLVGAPMHRLSRDGKLFAHHAETPHNALSDARAIVSYLAGDVDYLHYGVSERDLFLGLWRHGYPLDRRDVVIAWDDARSVGVTGAIATVVPNPNHKTLFGSTQFLIPEKLLNSEYVGAVDKPWKGMTVLYVPRVLEQINAREVTQQAHRMAR